jgi:hypothetical protein
MMRRQSGGEKTEGKGKENKKKSSKYSFIFAPIQVRFPCGIIESLDLLDDRPAVLLGVTLLQYLGGGEK